MSRRRSIETIQTAKFITIGELARLTNLRYSTLKYYTEEGMLPFVQAEERLTRRYEREKVMPILERINTLKKMGFRIYEIKQKL